MPAQLDLPELHRWWESPFSLRRAMRTGIYGPALAPFYAAGQTVQDAVTAAQSVLPPALPEPGAQPLPAEPQSEPAEQSPEPEPFVEASLPDLPDPDERMKLWD